MVRRTLKVFGIAAKPTTGVALLSVGVLRFFFVYPRRRFHVRSYRSFVATMRDLVRSGVDWVCVESRTCRMRDLPFPAAELPDAVGAGLSVVSAHKIHGIYVVLGEKGVLRACVRATKAKGVRYRLVYAFVRTLCG